jgi:hypothetical protein
MGMFSVAKTQWEIGALLEATVLFLALRRRLFERQPLLTIYLGLIVFNEFIVAIVYGAFGIRSYVSFYTFWGLQALLVSSRGSAVYEVCRLLLAPFAGVWRLSRNVLLLIAAILTITAIFAAAQSGPRFSAIISTASRGLELAIVGILTLGLTICRYYRVRVPGYLIWICLGFGFYATMQVVNDTFLRQWLLGYFPIWQQLWVLSFDIAVLMWCVALWKPLPALQRAPATLEPVVYETLGPQVTSRLRELNSRLLEMWK